MNYTHFVIDAEFHQRSRVPTRDAMVNAKAHNPFLVLSVRNDGHTVPFFYKAKSKSNIWLDITARADGQTHKVQGLHASKNFTREIDGFRHLQLNSGW